MLEGVAEIEKSRPTPLNVTVCGLPERLSSEMVSLPERVPPAVGVNVTLTVHWPPGPTDAPQLFV